MSFTPSLGCLPSAATHILHTSPVQIKSGKLGELISSFIWRYPILLNLWLQSNRGWNRDYRTKLGFKERVTLRITLWMVPQRKVLNFRIVTRGIEMSLDSWSVRNCKVGFCWETARGNAVRKKDDNMNYKFVTLYLQRITNEVCVYTIFACMWWFFVRCKVGWIFVSQSRY
jgi:hypothetical protein